MNLPPYWKHLNDEGEPAELPPAIAPQRLADPFAQLPPRLDLPPEVRSWHDVGNQTQFNSFEYLSLCRATSIRGPSPQSHEMRRTRLAELRQATEERGFRLPADFVTFLETDDYVSRLRMGSQSIQLPDFLCPCPLDAQSLMVLFLEEQGCNYTHLLLARDGTHCVTRSYGNGLDPSWTGAAPGEDERWICLLAGSFAEFLCRESDEIREYERGIPGEMVQWGDRALAAGDRRSALDCYQIALCHDPAAESIRRRIADLRGI